MLAVDPPLSGEKLLSAVTEAMVALHQRHYHRTPVSAKTLMLGEDLLACVLGGIYTEVEQTMIELERSTIVQETRSAFQTAIQRRFIDQVESLSAVSYTHLRAHETRHDLVCRLLLEKKKNKTKPI